MIRPKHTISLSPDHHRLADLIARRFGITTPQVSLNSVVRDAIYVTQALFAHPLQEGMRPGRAYRCVTQMMQRDFGRPSNVQHAKLLSAALAVANGGSGFSPSMALQFAGKGLTKSERASILALPTHRLLINCVFFAHVCATLTAAWSSQPVAVIAKLRTVLSDRFSHSLCAVDTPAGIHFFDASLYQSITKSRFSHFSPDNLQLHQFAPSEQQQSPRARVVSAYTVEEQSRRGQSYPDRYTLRLEP